MEWNLSPKDDALFGGVMYRDAAAIRRALRAGANVNCKRGVDGTTPLIEACQEGADAKIVRILLDAGANARCRDSGDYSAMDNACMEGRLSIVKLLLNHDRGLLELADGNGNTPLLVAIHYAQEDIVRFLLDRGANVQAATHDGRTAFMRAFGNGNSAIVQMLLAAGADVNARDESKQTALHHAARSGSVLAANTLILERNANMLVVDQDGKTPLDLFALRSNGDAVEMFLDIYAYNMTQNHGRRLALHVILGAAEYAFVENTEFHPPLKPSLQIRIPLGTLSCAHFRYLLSTLDPNSIRNRDDSGKLPVHVACRNNVPMEVLSMLVEIDAATLHMADHSGALPLHECCCGVVDDANVRFLVEQGGAGTLAARTREGALPLHVLCGSTNPSLRTVQFMIRSFPASVAARTNVGQYPFVIAACESSTASLSVVYELVRANPGLLTPN